MARIFRIFKQCIHHGFQLRTCAAQTGHDLRRPIETGHFAFRRPIRRRRIQNIAQIANLVGQFHEFGAARGVRRIFDLQLLARGFFQRFVIGQFHDDARHFGAEMQLQFFRRRVGIFNDVVQQGRAQNGHIINTAFIGQHIRQRDGMIDIRQSRRILAPLVFMLAGGKGRRFGKQGQRIFDSGHFYFH